MVTATIFFAGLVALWGGLLRAHGDSAETS